jgi:hypothetical protein
MSSFSMSIPLRLAAPMSPRNILFTQDSIAPYTTDEDKGASTSLESIIHQLEVGDLTPAQFKQIRVVRSDDAADGDVKYWALDNRRLYVFQQAVNVDTIDVDIVSRESQQVELELAAKMTTTCGGVSVRVRSASDYGSDKLVKMVFSLTEKTLQLRGARDPPRLVWGTLEEHILMWKLFVRQELQSELISKCNAVYHRPVPVSATGVEYGRSVVVTSLPDELQRGNGGKALRPGDVCLVRTEEGDNHLVIVEGRDRDVCEPDAVSEEADENIEMLSYRGGPSLAKSTWIKFVALTLDPSRQAAGSSMPSNCWRVTRRCTRCCCVTKLETLSGANTIQIRLSGVIHQPRVSTSVRLRL